MAFRDRTAKFLSYRDLNFAGSRYRRQAARRTTRGAGAGGGGAGKSRTRTSRSRDYVAVTVGEEDDSDDESSPVWTEFRDHVNNCIHEADQLLRELRQMHRSELGGFGSDSVQQKSEQVADRVTSKIKEAENSINMIYPKKEQKPKGSESSEEVVKRNIQTGLNQKLYRVTMQFRKQQKQFIRDKLALEKKKSKFANYFMNAADDIELPPDADDISDAQLQSMAISKNILTERDSQIAKVARGVQEIAELFKDLANMTIEQGTVLDRIDGQLDITLENAIQGTQEIVKAEEIQKNMSKSLKCVAILVAVVTLEVSLFILKHCS